MRRGERAIPIPRARKSLLPKSKQLGVTFARAFQHPRAPSKSFCEAELFAVAIAEAAAQVDEGPRECLGFFANPRCCAPAGQRLDTIVQRRREPNQLGHQ